MLVKTSIVSLDGATRWEITHNEKNGPTRITTYRKVNSGRSARFKYQGTLVIPHHRASYEAILHFLRYNQPRPAKPACGLTHNIYNQSTDHPRRKGIPIATR